MAAHQRHSSSGGGGGGRGPLGRKRTPGSEEDEETVYLTPLGAAKEVGRSCVILKHRVRHVDQSIDGRACITPTTYPRPPQ